MMTNQFHNLTEIENYIDSLSKHYETVKIINIGTSFEKRPIRGVIITKNNGKLKKKVLINGCIHAREWLSCSTMIYIMNELTNNSKKYDEFLSKTEVHIIPVVNTDGYVYTWNYDRLWRKTRSGPYNGCYGVDPNRNFDFKWKVSGYSTNPCDEIYAGEKPFSESESKAIGDYLKNAYLDGYPFSVYFDIHTYSENFIYPYGYDHVYPSNVKEMKEISKRATEIIYSIHQQNFNYGSISDIIYPASGSSIDYATSIANVKYAFAMELRPNEYNSNGFIIPSSQIIDGASEAWEGEYQENYVIGVPKVVCEDNDVSLDIITSKPFIGNIFVKGHAKDEACRQSYSSNGTSLYSLPLGECGMQRLRSANPKGISFSVTIIVSFHPSGFITKNDKAYKIRCFYMEPDEIVTNSIEVSDLTTAQIQDEMTMPACEYSVRKNSIDGPLLTYGNVGDVAYHVWECNGPSNIGILIKKCYVADGNGEDHSIIDVNGCTTDKFLLSEVTYDDNLMKAYATSAIFKYADSNQLYFTCQIRLCQKQMGLCVGVTPPKCSTTKIFSNKQKKQIEQDIYDNLTTTITPTEATQNENKLLTSSDGMLILKSGKNKREAGNSNDSKSLMEIDVASPELLILDKGEGVNFTNLNNYCIPETLLPLIPITLIVIIFISSILTFMISNIVTKKNICYGVCP